MPKSPEEKIKKIFAKTFPNLKIDKFNIDTPREKFENWDSLTHLQLVSEIEGSFKINFDIDEIAEIEKPSDFLKLIKNKTKFIA